MASTLPITTPHYEHDVANRIHQRWLKRFDEMFALSYKVLRRTGEVRNFHFDESLALWNAWESDQLSSPEGDKRFDAQLEFEGKGFNTA